MLSHEYLEVGETSMTETFARNNERLLAESKYVSIYDYLFETHHSEAATTECYKKKSCS